MKVLYQSANIHDMCTCDSGNSSDSGESDDSVESGKSGDSGNFRYSSDSEEFCTKMKILYQSANIHEMCTVW